MSHPDKCPICGSSIISVEYGYFSKYHHDGISEYNCSNTLADKPTCTFRQGRFCGKQLAPNEIEPPFCKGESHPYGE